MYARKLTKADLVADGITEITKEGRIFKGEKEIFSHWTPSKGTGDYLTIQIYERDSEGHLLKGKDRIYKHTRKDGTIGESISWQAKPRTIGLHRAMWAWHYGEAPEGYVVDHINNKHSRIEDYALDNLQLLTPKENLSKEKGESTKEVLCKLNRPRSYYEEKLAKYEAAYEQAKKDKNAKAAHKLRSNIAQTKARLRYWDSHKDEYEAFKAEQEKAEAEYEKLQSVKKELEIIKYLKKEFKKEKNVAKWRQYLELEKHWLEYDETIREQIMYCILKRGN